MNKLLPDEFEYHLLPKNSSIRKLCEEIKILFYSIDQETGEMELIISCFVKLLRIL